MNEPWDDDKEMMRQALKRLIAYMRTPEPAAAAPEAAAPVEENKRPRKPKKKEQANA